MPLPSLFAMRVRKLDDFIQNSSQTAIITQKHKNEVYSRLEMNVDSKFDSETIKEKTLSIEKNLDGSFGKKFRINFKYFLQFFCVTCILLFWSPFGVYAHCSFDCSLLAALHNY